MWKTKSKAQKQFEDLVESAIRDLIFSSNPFKFKRPGSFLRNHLDKGKGDELKCLQSEETWDVRQEFFG